MAKTREATVEICIATLTDICTDTEARDADRIAAAKLLMDICQDKGEAAGRAENNIEGRAGRILEIEHIIYIIWITVESERSFGVQ